MYECSWPAYVIPDDDNPVQPDYATIAKYCNYWRNWDDIEDSWVSVASIIDWYAKYQDVFVEYQGIYSINS